MIRKAPVLVLWLFVKPMHTQIELIFILYFNCVLKRKMILLVFLENYE